MGLFTNNKKPCPICGEGTPRLLATKSAENAPICSDCAKKISLVDALGLNIIFRVNTASI